MEGALALGGESRRDGAAAFRHIGQRLCPTAGQRILRMRVACPTRTCAHILTHLVIAHETSCRSCGSWHLWQAAGVSTSLVTCAFLWAGFLLAPDGFASAVAHTRLGCGWQGAKRFTLLPPAAHRFVYLRPHHDPRRRHARAHFGSVRQPGETASFPTWHESRIETDTALRADLGARETPCTRDATRQAGRGTGSCRCR